MRSSAKLKLGYYPLAPAEADRIRRFLQLQGEASVLDPCAGTGAALRTITQDAPVLRYGIELDAYRAGEAKRVLDHVVQGSVFESHAPVESSRWCIATRRSILKSAKERTSGWSGSSSNMCTAG